MSKLVPSNNTSVILFYTAAWCRA